MPDYRIVRSHACKACGGPAWGQRVYCDECYEKRKGRIRQKWQEADALALDSRELAAREGESCLGSEGSVDAPQRLAGSPLTIHKRLPEKDCDQWA